MRPPVTDLPLVFEAVGCTVGGVRVLDRIDLTIGRGSPTILIGPNGSGKTSLIRLGMGLERPTAGRITWGGRPDAGSGRRAIVFQRPTMLRRSAAANVAYAMAGTRTVAADKTDRVDELLARVGLAHLAERQARRLSGGEQQRLALARALAREPELLFLDEPTASLDPAATKAIEDIIADITARGITIVMATHDLGQARRIGGRIALFVRGCIAEHAPADMFFAKPATQEAAAFLRGDLVV